MRDLVRIAMGCSGGVGCTGHGTPGGTVWVTTEDVDFLGGVMVGAVGTPGGGGCSGGVLPVSTPENVRRMARRASMAAS